MNCIICQTEEEQGTLCPECKRFTCKDCVETTIAVTGKENCLYCGLTTKIGKENIKVEALSALSFLQERETTMGTIELNSHTSMFRSVFPLMNSENIPLHVPLKGNDVFHIRIELTKPRTIPIDAIIALQYKTNNKLYSDVARFSGITYEQQQTIYMNIEAKELIGMSVMISD